MPHKPLRACRYPGCPNLCKGVYCEEHQKLLDKRWANRGEGAEVVQQKEYDRQRGTAAQRGYDGKWQQARKGFLAKHPLCAECLKNGIYTPATVVDHIVPHRGNKALFWDKNNWQSLCQYHHNQKTARGE